MATSFQPIVTAAWAARSAQSEAMALGSTASRLGGGDTNGLTGLRRAGRSGWSICEAWFSCNASMISICGSSLVWQSVYVFQRSVNDVAFVPSVPERRSAYLHPISADIKPVTQRNALAVRSHGLICPIVPY